MTLYKHLILFAMIVSSANVLAYLRNYPLKITLRTEKEVYEEGEKITFLITFVNSNTLNPFPILLPSTTTKSLNSFHVYDRVTENQILRYTEKSGQSKEPNNIDTILPGDSVVIPISWNTKTNNMNGDTLNCSFGVPLFAGIYQFQFNYSPQSSNLAKAMYEFFSEFEKTLVSLSSKVPMPSNGIASNFCSVKIKRSKQKYIYIENQEYAIREDSADKKLFHYYKVDSINLPLKVHSTNLPADSFCIVQEEYFYSYFPSLWNEKIERFSNGRIRTYRKWKESCPEEIYAIEYNYLGKKTYEAIQLYDKKVLTSSYNQPMNTKHRDILCSADGTLGIITDYIYSDTGKFIEKRTQCIAPCSMEFTLYEMK